MKSIFIIIPFLFLFACGSEQEGITIEKNGHDIQDRILESFLADDHSHEIIFGDSVDYYQLAVDNGLTIKIQDTVMWEGKEIRGLTLEDNSIQINYPENESDRDACMDLYYVLSHELLHYACLNGLYGNCDESLNAAHTLPNIFIGWGFQQVDLTNGEVGPSSTIEYWSYWELDSLCGG